MVVHRTRAFSHSIFANRLRTVHSLNCPASKNSIHVPRAGIVSCMLSMEPHAVGLSASHSSGRLCRVRHDRAKQRRAEQRAERPEARLVCICASLCICTGACFCRRTSYQQPETDVGNFSICKGKAPAPLACSITQRNATQRNGPAAPQINTAARRRSRDKSWNRD